MVVATVVLRKPQSAAAKDGPLTVSAAAMAVFGVVMTFGLHRDPGAAAGVRMS